MTFIFTHPPPPPHMTLCAYMCVRIYVCVCGVAVVGWGVCASVSNNKAHASYMLFLTAKGRRVSIIQVYHHYYLLQLLDLRGLIVQLLLLLPQLQLQLMLHPLQRHHLQVRTFTLYLQPHTFTLYLHVHTFTLYLQLHTFTLYPQWHTFTLYLRQHTFTLYLQRHTFTLYLQWHTFTLYLQLHTFTLYLQLYTFTTDLQLTGFCKCIFLFWFYVGFPDHPPPPQPLQFLAKTNNKKQQRG